MIPPMSHPTDSPRDVPPPDRWGQLTYTSFDDGSGFGGGWQVKNVSGGVTARERDVLTSMVSTRFDVEPALPQFPTPTDIAERPCRLMYAPTENGAGFWHTVDAGLDGSGRPGNVFAHVLVDRAIASPIPAPRPIEFWKSPLWLRPYGPSEVARSTLLESTIPDAGPVITRSTTIEFLLESLDRQNLFQVLLDAVLDAMSGGPMVILLVDGWDEGASWIGAVSFFMSPNTSRRLSWTTYDRPQSLAEDIRRGIELVAVPNEHAGAIDPELDCVVLDTRDEPNLGVLGGFHSLAKGFEVRVTPWSMVAQESLVDHETLEAAVEEQDSIAMDVGDRNLSPMWPLSVAVLSSSEVRSMEAMRVVVEHAPRHLHESPRLAELVQSIRRESAPKRAADAWNVLERTLNEEAALDFVLPQYVECALNDPDWLFGDAYPPQVEDRFACAPTHFTEQALAACAVALMGEAEAVANDIDVATVLFKALRTANLVFSCLVPIEDAVIEPLSLVLDRISKTPLFDETRSLALIERTGPVGERALRQIVRPAVEESAQFQKKPFGSRLTTDVFEWLFPRVYARTSALVSLVKVDRTALFGEYLFAVLRTAREGSPAHIEAKPLAYVALRAGVASGQLSNELRRSLNRIAWECDTTTAEVLRLFDEFGAQVPTGVAFGTLAFAPASSSLDQVIDHVIRQRDAIADRGDSDADDDLLAISCSLIRGIRYWTRMTTGDLEMLVDQHFEPLMRRLSLHPGISIPSDLLLNMSVLYRAAQSLHRPWVESRNPAHDSLLSQFESAEVSGPVSALASIGLISVEWIASRSFLEHLSQSGSFDPTPSVDVALLGASGARYRQSTWTSKVLAELVRSGSYEGPSTPAALRDAIWPDVKMMTAAHAELVFSGYAVAADEWLRSNQIPYAESSVQW